MSEKKNIYESICGVMADIGAVGKDSRNAQQGFMFRGIDAVMNALSPALVKNKVFIVPTILEQTREERVNKNGTAMTYSICKTKYTFYAEDGSFIEATVIGEGSDAGDKATNKAMSIAFKYACFQVLCIPTEELMDDPDKEYHELKPKAEPKTKKPEPKTEPKPEVPAVETPMADGNTKISAVKAKALAARCKKDGISEELILKLYKVKAFDELTETKYVNIHEHWEQVVERCKA